MRRRFLPFFALLLGLLLVSCGTKPAIVSAPTPASDVSVSAATDAITVTWQDNSDDETGFAIYRAAVEADVTAQNLSFAVIAEVEADVTRYVDREVVAGTRYRYMVAAIGAGGSAEPTESEDPEPVGLENRAPTADSLTLSTDEDSPLTLTLTGSDAEGAELAFEIVSAPEHGELSGDAPELTYTPATDFSGSDAFAFRVSDGELASAEATVSISVGVVNDPPVAEAQSLATERGAPLDVTLNGTDTEGATLIYAIVDGPDYGRLSGDAPQLTYTPDAGFTGSDAFTFRASDGELVSGEATVHIEVVLPDPVASMTELGASAPAAVVGGVPVTLTAQLRDADGEPVELAGQPITFVPSSGGVAAADDAPASRATVSTDADGRSSVEFVPDANGTVTIAVYWGDDASGEPIGTFTVEVSAVVLLDDTVTYDGEAHALQPQFSPPEAGVGATVTYERLSDGAVSTDAPSRAGVYRASVTTADGYDGSATATLTIEPRTLEVQPGFEFADKVYDGGSAATASVELDTSNVVSGDDVGVDPATRGEFQLRDGDAWIASRKVGLYGSDEASRVIGTLELVGFDASNYAIEQPIASAAITPRPLELSGAAAADRPYDGTLDASVTGTLSPAPYVRDDVAVAATFGSADAGEAIAVTVELVGADAANYTLTDPALTAAITPRPVTVTADDRSKVYGEALELGSEAFSVDDLVEGESLAGVTLASPGAAADADAGSFEIAASDAVAGAATKLANYAVTYATGTLEVAAATLTVRPDAEQGKTYGDADPALTFTVEGLIDGDIVVGSLARVEGENAGSYAFTLGDLAVDDGVNGANYQLVLDDAASFTVAPRPLLVTPDAEQGKTYGDADPAFTLTTEGLVEGDTLTGALGRAEGEDVGSYGYTLGDLAVDDGNESANYALALAEVPGFAIAPRVVTVSGAFTAEDRVYDGTTDATIATDELTLENVVEGDAVELLPVASFDDRFVAEGKAVTLSGDTALAGAPSEAGNYTLDLTGSPTTTATITKAPISFQITNKDALVYDGSTALPLVVVTDPVAAPESEPVAYQLQYRLVEDSLGQSVDQGVSAIRDAGSYRVTVTSTDARYDGQDEIVVTVAHRPVTLTSEAGGKVYGEQDPDLTPSLSAGSLGADDVITGELGYGGATDAGSYALDLGSVAFERGGADVTANYAITVEGDFEIAQAPVSFDIANSDFVQDGVHVFVRDGATQVGLDIASDPAGVTDFVLSYRRTHDAAHNPVPEAEQPVPTIEALGTYEVTIATTDPNYVGTSVRTVWLTDGASFDLAGDLTATSALVGGVAPVTFELVGGDGAPRAAGPLPIGLDLSAPEGVTFLDPATGEAVTSVAFPAGATSVTVEVRSDALADAPYALVATPSGGFGGAFNEASWTHEALATLAFVGDAPATGAGALSEPIAVELRGAGDAPIVAAAPIALDLIADAAVVLRDEADTSDVTGVVIAAGESRAAFRATSDTAGSYTLRAANASTLVGVADSPDLTLTVTPRPVASTLSPSTLEKGQTATLTVAGSGFADGLVASFDGSDVTVDAVTVDSDSQLTLSVTIDGSSSTGTRALTLVNADGGTSSLESALTLTVPTLTANDDGPYELVEGGSTTLAIADLLANDGSSSSTVNWGFDAVVATQNVDAEVSGGNVTVSSTGSFGQAASLDYRIVDAFGTTAVATVTFAVSLPPVDAILFTDPLEFDDFKSAQYSVPTFKEVFDTWPRVSGGTYYADPSTVLTGSNADAWQYLEDDVTGDNVGDPRVSQPNNVSPPEGFVSPEEDAQDYFTFEATLFSDNSDNDSIGLIAAFTADGGTPRYLVAHRTYGGNRPSSGWGLSYYDGRYQTVLAEPSVAAFDTSQNAWSGDSSRVKVERTGDILRFYATDWNATGSYDPASEITVDLANNTVTVNGSTTTVAQDLSIFQGRRQYGYFTYSQPNSTYLDIAFEGGVARDVAILLTGGADTDATAGDDAWSGSEVWRFANDVWSLDSGATIQTELGYPRTVTSVAEPGTGSSYTSYSDYGRSFRVLGQEVVLQP